MNVASSTPSIQENFLACSSKPALADTGSTLLYARVMKDVFVILPSFSKSCAKEFVRE